MQCPELALRLSENYYSAQKFNNLDESLSGYLNQNGILLTMCFGQMILPRLFGGPCRLGVLSNHVSASWIRNIETGFRIFGPPPPDELPIGLILDPITSDINCVYPVDAVTDSRLDKGCGFQPDAPEASNNYRRFFERYEIVKYKNDVFGKDVKWGDIDCEDFLGNTELLGTFAVNNSDCSLAMVSAAKFYYDTYSNLVGHPVCNATKAWVEPAYNTTDAILYMGSCIWKPSEWRSMIDTMVKAVSEYPHAHLWNEINIAKPRTLKDIVQAVFLIDGSFDHSEHEAAKMEARRLGKPLLVLHPPDANSNLTFTCDESISLNLIRKTAIE